MNATSANPLLFVAISLFTIALPQGVPQTAPAPTSREAMWFAPTEEDWKKPCLITWQRTFEDAVTVSKETGKPILICVNMDGEIASEHYAGVRYRQPDKAKLYEPYVCVIASVYRHTPRDYDEQGRRILCPRFGSVTCAEHIAIEPGLFDKYFEGQRVAPRHIGIELDHKESFDVFYAFDTDSVFKAIKDGAAKYPANPPSGIHGDQNIVDRVGSAHIEDKKAVENAFLQAEVSQKRAILRAALEKGEKASIEVLRLALFTLDPELNRIARNGLANATSEASIDLIVEALRTAVDASEREALLQALTRIGEKSQRARLLASVHRGLDAKNSVVDVENWSKALDGPGGRAAPTFGDSYAAESKVAYQSKTASQRPNDPNALLELAEATLAYAFELKTSRKNAKLIFQDAHRAAIEAEKQGASGWRVNAVVALAAYYLDDSAQAHARAEAAVNAMPSEPSSWNAMAVLALFADARQSAILGAVRTKGSWPNQWLADANSAYTILRRHPLGTDAHVAAHYDFLRQMGAHGVAARVLDSGLDRFNDSALLHERFRGRMLTEKGVGGLEAAYAALLRDHGDWRHIEWFTAYAAHSAAEFHKQSGHNAEASAAYDRAIEHYEAAIVKDPKCRPETDPYIAMALAGRGRIALESGNLELAAEQIFASFARKVDVAATEDGLGRSAVATAKLLLARAKAEKRDDLATKVDAALSALDPKLLELPAYERGGPEPPASRPQRRRR